MTSMVSKYNSWCKVCKGQIFAGNVILWEAGYGAKHVTCPPRPAQTIPADAPKIDLSKVVTFINRAKGALKFPKLRFLSLDGKHEIRLSVAGETSKFQGTIQVKLDGEWVGRIEADGTPSWGLLNKVPFVIESLQKIAENPAEAAKQYAQIFGSCSFCGLTLTDAGSIEVGYGPICAQHYGLPHTPKGTPVIILNPEAAKATLAEEVSKLGLTREDLVKLLEGMK